MSALGKVVRAGVGRRRLQSLLILLTTMMAVTAALLAAGLLAASHGPFDQAFNTQRGAHLTAQYDGLKVTSTQLASTTSLPGVSGAAGPYPAVQVRPRFGPNSSGMPVGYLAQPVLLVGRADPDGPVDDLVVTAGHWSTGPGQVVLDDQNSLANVGDRLNFPDLPGSPVLTVVGLARSVGLSADGWVSPAELHTLLAPGAVPDQQMLYRFTQAATDQQLNTDRSLLVSAVPAGSLTSAASYLKVKLAAERTAATYVPFLLSFGVLGLGMSVLVIGVVVSGAVGSATRRIGILKAVGFTPEQVVRAYIGLALIPAAAGTVLGLLLGNLAAIPVLGSADAARVAGSTTIDPWVDLAVAALALTAVALAALVPALRAGWLRTVTALGNGRTPTTGRGLPARRLIARLPLPRAVALGLARPFSHPGRSATMAAAVILGTIGATFGSGLAISLNAVQNGQHRRSPGAVTVNPVPPPGLQAPGTTHDPSIANLPAVEALIAKQPGTGRYFSYGQTTASVAGLAGPTTVLAYRGDYSWGAYQMVSGRWFRGPGEAVVPSGFLTATGTRVGDSVTLANAGHTARVRIVGEAFSVSQSGMLILTDQGSLTTLGTELVPESIEYDIDLAPGTDQQAYLQGLTTSLAPYGLAPLPGNSGPGSMVISMDALALMLTLMLITVAGLGVLNTVLLDLRERIHDLGVFKALGMSPRQLLALVLSSVTGIGLLAGLVGVPIGIALHDYVLPAMGRAAGTRLPAADIDVYHPLVLVPLLLGGLVIALVGACFPAGWVARSRTATALRTE
ncbi:ABC transporter permease [Kitasatospora viridis]|uniref:Putative ABC transport system permease protein n=1 Tax=Kitasatospora viridis TaxID=281105 RepID=A0A561UI65_9ACTN|nr:ABC transporter permease [Kitasatospora viridis]TWF99045.1 putative ABC transport system permease protein [Kitasatospora viridis]